VFCPYEELSNQQQNYFIETHNAQFFPLHYYIKLLTSEKTEGIIIHNLFGFDLPAIEKIDGGSFDYNKIQGHTLELIDTLAMSRNLNPERQLPKGCPTSVPIEGQRKAKKIAPHGLEAWGYRAGIKKPDVQDWSDQPLSVYIERVIEDVKINKASYFLMQKEMQDVAIQNGEKKGSWETAIKMGNKVYFLMTKQERDGAVFDIDKAVALLERLDTEMKEIEDRINPLLGERDLPKSEQPKFPVKPYKKDGTLSSTAYKYAEKFGITDPNEINNLIQECLYDSSKIPKLKEKMTLYHGAEVKAFLYNQGWEPVFWKNRDIITDLKTKKPKSDKKQHEGAIRYIKELQDSPYKKDWLKELGYKKEPDYNSQAFFKKVLKKGRNLRSSPQFKDDRGELCPNLFKLQGDTAKDIITWLTLKHRRTTIKSFDKDTGWLNHPRLQKDGRLPASHSGLTNTRRQKHSVCANLPAADDKVLYGKEIRDLFCAPEGYVCIGTDAKGIEGRCMAEAAWNFDNGEYADIILKGDVHELNAKQFSEATGQIISRSGGKPAFYAGLYGCTGIKQAALLGVDEALGEKVNEALWKVAWGLKYCKDELEYYWDATGKKYIMGIDGSKIYTRSKHSLLNAYIQSMDSIIMDWACCYMYDKIKQESLDSQRWIYYHDEVNYYHNKQDLSVYYFPVDQKPEEYRDGYQYSKPKLFRDGKIFHFDLKAEDYKKTDQWVQWYSRVGEICVEAIRKAGKFFGLRVPMDGQYIVGRSWMQTH